MSLIESLTLVFGVSAVALFVSDRLNQPTVPAFVVSGFALSYLVDGLEVTRIAVLGAGFLVFSFGIRMNPARVLEASESWVAAAAQVGVTAGLGLAVSLGLGLGVPDTLMLVSASALASSAAGMNLIEEQNSIGLLFSEVAESVQFVQDLLAVAVLGGVAVLISGQPVTGFVGTLALFGGVVVLRPVFERLIGAVDGSRESVMVISLGSLSVFVLAASLLGLSPVAGALAGGLAIAAFPHNIEVLDSVRSLHDFFSAVFFVSLGLLVEASAGGLLVAATVLLLTVVVGPVAAALALSTRLDLRTSVLSSVSLDQVSEVVLAGAIQLHIAGMLSPQVFNGLVLGSAATFVVSAYTTVHRDAVYSLVSSYVSSDDAQPLDVEDHVIVVGHDEQGRKIVRDLERDTVVLENNPERAESSQTDVVLGNALEDSTWRKANLSEAAAVVSTVPSRPVSEKLLTLDVDLPVVPRARSPSEATEYLSEGAWTVNFPEAMASEEILDHIEGSLNSREYMERLRRQSITELKSFLRE